MPSADITMDGVYAENAGANYLPFKPNHGLALAIH